MLQPVRDAFGGYMVGFFNGLLPTTKALQEYVLREPEKALMWAPARMVDAAEEMLASYQRNDNNDGPTRPAQLPVIIVAMAKDYTATGRDYTTQIADPVHIAFPDDERERAFKLQTIAVDIRAQIAIFAQEPETAKSLAGQFSLYIDSPVNRRFASRWLFNNFESFWPVQIEAPDVLAISVATDAKNLTMLAIDLTLKATIPLFRGPGEDEFKNRNVSQATDDIPGFGGVEEVTSNGVTVARID